MRARAAGVALAVSILLAAAPLVSGSSGSVLLTVEPDAADGGPPAIFFPVGSPRAVEIRLENPGEEPVSGDLVAEATVNGTPVHASDALTLPAGESRSHQLEVTWPAMASGTLTVGFHTDGGDRTREIVRGVPGPPIDAEIEPAHEGGRYVPMGQPIHPTVHLSTVADESVGPVELMLDPGDEASASPAATVGTVDPGSTQAIHLPALDPSDLAHVSVSGGATATTTINARLVASVAGPPSYEGPLYDLQTTDGIVTGIDRASFSADVLLGTALELDDADVASFERSTVRLWLANFRDEGTAGGLVTIEVSPLFLAPLVPDSTTTRTRSVRLSPFDERVLEVSFVPNVAGPHRLEADVDGHVLGGHLEEQLLEDAGAPVSAWGLEGAPASLQRGGEGKLAVRWTAEEKLEEAGLGLAVSPVQQREGGLEPGYGDPLGSGEGFVRLSPTEAVVSAEAGHEQRTAFELEALATGVYRVVPYLVTDEGFHTFPDPASGSQTIRVEAPAEASPLLWAPLGASMVLAAGVTVHRVRLD